MTVLRGAEAAPHSELLTVAVTDGDKGLSSPDGVFSCAFDRQGGEGGSEDELPERSRVLRDPAGHPFCLRT